mmetsp:Transcript_10807/g.25796  ORF Transcript_10807/g.25796 Transcript_10807/m.25796 type:complete len:86 (+) Transcript_10807:1227-1484(+)
MMMMMKKKNSNENIYYYWLERRDNVETVPRYIEIRVVLSDVEFPSVVPYNVSMEMEDTDLLVVLFWRKRTEVTSSSLVLVCPYHS